MMTTDLYEANMLGPGTSLLVIAVCSLALISLAIVALARARRRAWLAADAAATMNSDRVLHEGEIVLSGVVEHAPEQDVAVRVEVTQQGDERESSGSWSHSWREVDRRIVVAPFYLRLADGTRVRVEAPPDVDVADDLDRKVLVSRTSRVLSAELVPGESLHARGWLERGDAAMPGAGAAYRDVTWGWLLRPARGRMMLSSHPLGRGLQERAAFHRWYGRLVIVVFAGLQLWLSGYYALASGSVETAQIVDKHHTSYHDSDGDPHHHYDVVVRLGRGPLRTVDIDGSDFDRAEGKVAVRHGALGWKLGAQPTLSFAGALVPLIGVILLWFTYRRRRQTTRPWFRRRVEHHGSGRLPDPTPA